MTSSRDAGARLEAERQEKGKCNQGIVESGSDRFYLFETFGHVNTE